MTAHVTITEYGTSTNTICIACATQVEHGHDHRGAAADAAEHNRLHHPPTV
jgi:hypothetical protein